MRLGRWSDLLCAVYLDAGTGLQALETLVRYLLAVNETVGVPQLGAILAAATGPEVMDMAMSTADKLRAQGLEEGLEKGREEGLEKGREEGREAAREMLLHLLHSRFGELSDTLVERIHRAELPALRRWFDRALTATGADGALSPE